VESEIAFSPSLARRPYFCVPDRTDEEVYRAFLQCFSSPAGQLVLDRLYWRVMMASPPDLRAVWKQDLFREIIDCMQRGAALVQQVTPQ
jgi:hypothetical protein